MPLDPLTPEEKRIADRIQSELIEISQKQHEEAVSNGYKCYFDYYMAGKKPKDAEGLDDAIEDVADEFLLWAANKRYSRWIVALLVGGIFALGWYSNQFYHPIHDYIMHNFVG